MTHRIFNIILWLCGLSIYSFGQDAGTLKGKVTDAITGTPVAAASVFINNSTYVRICDENGIFDLKGFPPTPFELTITAVGYEAAVLKIKVLTSEPLQVRLKQKVIDLNEVTILSPEKDGWAKYGALFTAEFIGYSPFAAQCEILNKEILEFRYDKKNNVLKVSAERPISIRNKATGYLITYWLEDFDMNYQTRKLYFKGYTQFKELASKRKKKIKEWASNRSSAYKGSLCHFMRSVYKGNPLQEGFEIRRLKKIKREEYGKYVPVRTDTISSEDTMKMTALFSEIFGIDADSQTVSGSIVSLLQWKSDATKTDPVKIVPPPVAPDTVTLKEYIFAKDKLDRNKMIVNFYDFNRPLPEDHIDSLIRNMDIPIKIDGNLLPKSQRQISYDILDFNILNIDSFTHRINDAAVQLYFPDYWQVTYVHELEEDAYLKRQGPPEPVKPDQQVSVISINNEKKGIRLYVDGNFYEPYDLLVEKYWSYEKLDKLLPLDYEP